MNKVYACIDGAAGTPAVIDWAVWSAQRLGVPLELLHALERPSESTPVTDHSGAIGLDAQFSLLQELSTLDEQHARFAQEAGRRLLAGARERAAAAGVVQLDARLRHGALVDTVIELEPDARLFVLGTHRRAATSARLHLDHRVEQVIRAVKRPVLVVTNERFAAVPERFVLAYDGSATARKAISTVARSPLLAGLQALVVTAGEDERQARGPLDEAQGLLDNAGFETETAFIKGEADTALPDFLKARSAALLVMGAYGHSRLRSFLMGSTTTAMLRLSEVPVLILR